MSRMISKMLRTSALAVVFLAFPAGVLANSAPVVSNVTASQRTDSSKKVDLRYNLADADGDACTVAVIVSNDAGATWTVSATALTGAVGSGVTPGVGKLIVWDCRVDLPGAVGSQFKVKVCADDDADVIFQDHFDAGAAAWTPIDGTWSVVGGVYHGEGPEGIHEDARSIVGTSSWTDYVYTGRFRVVQGIEATILFRVQDALAGKNQGHYYQIANYPTGVVWIQHISNGNNPLISSDYNIEYNRWYTFRLDVRGSTVDYSIDGNPVLHYDGLTYAGGGIGVKTYKGVAEFDDILVRWYISPVPEGMVLIPAGQFQMGNALSATGDGSSIELPVHTVNLDAFYMDRTEVTNQQYADALNWAKAQGNLITVTSGVVYKYNSGTSYTAYR